MGFSDKRHIDTVNPEDSSLNQKGFVGTDPIYQNFANETDAPAAAIDGKVDIAEASGVPEDVEDGDEAADSAATNAGGETDEEREKREADLKAAASRASTPTPASTTPPATSPSK